MPPPPHTHPTPCPPPHPPALQVRLAVHHLSQRKVAVKVIDKQKLTDPNEAKRMQREIRVMKHLSHQVSGGAGEGAGRALP